MFKVQSFYIFLISSLNIYTGILVGGSETDRPLHLVQFLLILQIKVPALIKCFNLAFIKELKGKAVRHLNSLAHIAHYSLHKQG